MYLSLSITVFMLDQDIHSKKGSGPVRRGYNKTTLRQQVDSGYMRRRRDRCAKANGVSGRRWLGGG
jgi:hypothetical protein